MGRSSGVRRRTAQGVPLVDYPLAAGLPAVSVERWRGAYDQGRRVLAGTHAHDFLMLLYVEQGRDVLRVDGRDRALGPGDVLVLAPGAVVTPPAGHGRAETWGVFFLPAAVGPPGPGRTHPLLAPFVGDPCGGARRLSVPAEERAAWLADLGDLAGELRGRRDGYADAARAHLTLLLVRLGRLRADGAVGLGSEPLLATVFELIETRYHQDVSLRDVAAAVSLTPGHLTTVVGRRTGRTVQQWITERRLREARRLLADTDLTVAEIARRVGYRDGGYFVRRFRVAHGVTPAAWRRAGRQGRGG